MLASEGLLKEYWAGLRQIPQLVRRISFRPRTLEEELQEAVLRGSLRKAFGRWDLLFLGLGIVIGSGWAQLTAETAQAVTSTSIVVSYLLSGLSSLMAAACYAELCVEYPVSGGAFSYVTFGELPAWLTVARGFSNYLAQLCGAYSNIFVIDMIPGPQSAGLDLMAGAIVLVFSVLLGLGVKESTFFISSYSWMRFVMAVGALLGIVTALLVGLYSVARIAMAAGRDWLLPPFLARISPRTQTPLGAQMTMGVLIAFIATLAPMENTTITTTLGAFGCLFAMYSPGVKLKYSRYGTVEQALSAKASRWVPGSRLSSRTRQVLVWAHLAGITATSVAFSTYYEVSLDNISGYGHTRDEGFVLMGLALLWLLVTLSLQARGAAAARAPPTMVSLPNRDYPYIACWIVLILLVYFVYSLPMSYVKRNHLDFDNTEQLLVVELVLKDGQWVERGGGRTITAGSYSVVGAASDGTSPRSFYLSSRQRSGQLATLRSAQLASRTSSLAWLSQRTPDSGGASSPRGGASSPRGGSSAHGGASSPLGGASSPRGGASSPRGGSSAHGGGILPPVQEERAASTITEGGGGAGDGGGGVELQPMRRVRIREPSGSAAAGGRGASPAGAAGEDKP
eukprot:scaffold3.g6247.t1